MREGFRLPEGNVVSYTNKREEKSRDRVLSPAELRIILNNLGDDHFGSIIRLLAYLGQRAGEVSGLRWSEIDFNANSILLASSRTKNGRPHTVLMSAAMFEVLVRGRVARPVEDLDDDTLNAIANSAVAPEFAALDKIIKNWSP